MTLQGDMFFAITAAAALFCLAIAAALVWAQGRELKRKDAIIERQEARLDQASKNDHRDERGRYAKA